MYVMATDKKGFILYADLIHTVNKLPSEKAGELFKHILSYVNDEGPKTDDIIISIAFEPIKQQLKRDLKKFEEKRKQWSEAGKKSAEARAKKKAEELQRTLTTVETVATDLTVNDNVNVNVNVKDKDITFKQKKEKFLVWFNFHKGKQTGTKGKFKVLTSTDDNNLKKLSKDYSKAEFEIAIKNLFKSKWAIENNMLTPSHFLRVENFNKYLNQGDNVKKLNTFD